MASKKVNPQALAQLAKQKTASAAEFRRAEEAGKKPRVPSAPSPTTTVPPTPPVDWETELFGTTTTTTTVPPSTTTTTIPGTVKPPKGAPSTDPLSVKLNKNIAEIEGKLFATTPKETIEKVKTGEVKGQPFWKKAIGFAINNPIAEATVLRPLKTLAFVSRVGVSTFEESVQAARKLTGKEEKYEAGDYIPLHKQTGKPIAGAGAPIIRNWEEIINTPISEDYKTKIESATTEKERNRLLNEATYSVVKDNARTASGSFTEWARQIGTPNEFKDYGFGDIAEVQIGRQLVEAGKVSPAVGKWIDRGIGFTGDVVLDPTTYLSLGTTTAAKAATKPLGGAANTLIDIAANDLATQGIKRATKNAAVQIAELTGEKVGAKTTQQSARAVVAEGAKILKYKVSIGEITGRANEAVDLDKLIRTTARRWSAIAPRREVGASARQSTAAMVSDLREEAIDLLADLTPASMNSAQARSAYEFTKVITDDVIKDIAVRGNAAITGDVARVLSTPGGLRWGLGKYKFTLPGTENLTATIGKGFTLPRKALAATQLGRKAIDVTTRVGSGGLFGDEYIFNWRTGLRSGYNAKTGAKLTGEEAVEAIKRLSEDQVYRALKKATSQTIKQGVDSIFKAKEYRPYHRTVHTLLTDPTINWSQTAEQIVTRTGRPLAEVNFALRIRDLRKEFGDIIDQLSATMDGRIVLPPENWFPQALSDKAVIWLNKNTPIVRDTLRALGLDAPPAAGKSIADELVAGMKWFGHTLTNADIEEGISRLNFLANNPARGVQKFTGEFFDTNAASAVEKWARKFSDDYAFLRNAARSVFDTAGGVARTTEPTVFSLVDVENIKYNDFINFARRALIDGDLDGALSDYGVRLAKELDLKIGDIEDVVRQMKDEITFGADWFLDDAGRIMIDGIENRFNLGLVQKRLDNLVSDGGIESLQAAVSGRRAEILRTPKTQRNANILEDQDYALGQVQRILDSVYEEMLVGGKSAYEYLDGLPGLISDELESLRALFAQSPERFTNVIDNIDPRMLKTMVNFTEDALVKLDNMYVPDLYAQREIAQMYYNVRRLKEPKFQNATLRFMRNFNRFIKTWVTSTPGFHLRNFVSNAWQMVATGANPGFLNEGLGLMNEWNSFIKASIGTIEDIETIVDDILMLPSTAKASDAAVGKLARKLNRPNDDILNMKYIMEDMITNRGVPRDDWRFLADFTNIQTKVQDPELLLDTFLTDWLPQKTKYFDASKEKFTPAQQEAFRETMMWTGAAGFGDVEEVFGAVIPSRMGITGAEVPVRTSPVGRAASKASEVAGALPRASRNFGAKIENYSRFMLTYDGIRQGLTPEQAAARTARYLVDYEDLTKLDEVAKLIFPFWMWMSRNLPVQTANMFMNPKAYAIYQDFRQNFEDENGDNALLPSYLKDAGAFKAPFGENIYIKPDLGFPGAGSPSPLQSGVTDFRSLLSAIPLAGIGAAAAGEELFTGRPLEGFGERAKEIAGQVLPPLSTAGRYVSGLGGAGRDLPGPSWAQELLGVPTARESGPQAQSIRALSSLLGIPLTTVGPDQENIARYEQLDRLKAYEEWIRNQGRR